MEVRPRDFQLRVFEENRHRPRRNPRSEGEESEAEVSDLNRQYWKLQGVADCKDDIDYSEPRNIWLLIAELDRVFNESWRIDRFSSGFTLRAVCNFKESFNGDTFNEAALKALIDKLKGSS
jgi:hypothetical protein